MKDKGYTILVTVGIIWIAILYAIVWKETDIFKHDNKNTVIIADDVYVITDTIVVEGEN